MKIDCLKFDLRINIKDDLETVLDVGLPTFIILMF